MEGVRNVLQLTCRPAHRARVIEQAWGVDVSQEILKPIRSQNVADSESDVVHLLWNYSDQGNNFIQVAIVERWLTNPLAEHSTTSSARPVYDYIGRDVEQVPPGNHHNKA